MATGVEVDSLFGLGRKVAQDAAALLSSEIEFAKAQLKENLKRFAGVIFLAAAALVFIVLTLVFALSTLASWLSPLLFHNPWMGYAILALVFLAVAVVMTIIAVRLVKRIFQSVEDVMDSYQEDIEWVTQLRKRNEE